MREKIEECEYALIATLPQIRRFLKITGNYEDEIIKTLFEAAVFFAEGEIEREISLKTITLKGKYIKPILLRNNIIEVISVLSDDVDVKYNIAKNHLKANLPVGSEMQIKYSCGMDFVNEDLRMAILYHTFSLYDGEFNSFSVPRISMEIYKRIKQINL